jgi:hypothetical protein
MQHQISKTTADTHLKLNTCTYFQDHNWRLLSKGNLLEFFEEEKRATAAVMLLVA